MGPIDVLLNKGFNFAQADNRSRRIFEAGYGARHVWNSVVHPLQSIANSGGWGDFFEHQILPVQAWNWIKSGFRWEEVDNMTRYLGGWVNVSHDGSVAFGLSHRLALGLGVGGLVGG